MKIRNKKAHALTDRQQAILLFIADFTELKGYPPTIREIGDHFGIRSTNGVNDHLLALRRKGYLMWSENKRAARTLRVTRTADEAVLGYRSAVVDGLIADGESEACMYVLRLIAAGDIGPAEAKALARRVCDAEEESAA